MTDLKDRAVKTQQQSSRSTYQRHSLSVRPRRPYDLFFIEPLPSGAGNLTGFSNIEKKTETYTKCQDGGIHPKLKNKIRSRPEFKVKQILSNMPDGDCRATILSLLALLEKRIEDLWEAFVTEIKEETIRKEKCNN